MNPHYYRISPLTSHSNFLSTNTLSVDRFSKIAGPVRTNSEPNTDKKHIFEQSKILYLIIRRQILRINWVTTAENENISDIQELVYSESIPCLQNKNGTCINFQIDTHMESVQLT